MKSLTVSNLRVWAQSSAIYLRPRLLLILAQGFASGMPLLLTLSTLSYWLAKVHVDRATIGVFALTGTPYTFKFLWSPIIDQVSLPLISRWLGRRRSWLFVLQLALAGAIYLMGLTDPSKEPMATALAAMLVAFLSASQDIVIDAYRIEILSNDEQGPGAGATQVGYRIGLLLSGAGALALADHFPWPFVFSVLAVAMLLCAAITLIAPRPPEPKITTKRSYQEWLEEAVIEPFADFMKRRGWFVILAFVAFYKFGDAIGGWMANPFYDAMGFTGTEIAAVSKVWGVIATALGAVIGGTFVTRYGLFRTLMLGGIFQAVTNFGYCIVAWRGHDIWALTGAISIDNFAGGFAGAAMVAYLSSLTNVAFTATQYALLSSLSALGRTVMSTPSGWLSVHLSWTGFFSLTAFLAIPGLLLLFWLFRLYPDREKAEGRSAVEVV